MNPNVHLDVGTRVININDGRLGHIAPAHYLARPAHHEIDVHYDGSPPDFADCVSRSDIEFEGSDAFARAMKRWHQKNEDPPPNCT